MSVMDLNKSRATLGPVESTDTRAFQGRPGVLFFIILYMGNLKNQMFSSSDGSEDDWRTAPSVTVKEDR